MSDRDELSTLEELLDSVTDAISGLVVFASEVQTDEQKLKHLQAHVGVVQQATQVFAAEPSKTIVLWRNFGQENMASEMQQACDGLQEASDEIAEAIGILAKERNSAEAKNKILDGGKAILKHMVRLIQLNDLYEVTVILKQLQALRQLLETRDDAKFVVGEFALMAAFLCKLLAARVRRCYDSRVRKSLEETSVEVGRVSIPLTEVEQAWLDNPKDVTMKERREMLVTALKVQMKKAHEATRLSAKSPFDLSMLDRDLGMDFDEDFVAISNMNWNDGLDALQTAIKNGDESELESALRAIRKDVLSQLEAAEEAARNIQDPELREKMLTSLARLRNQMENMLDKLGREAREALKSRNPDMIKAGIEELRRLRAKILDGLAKDNLLQHAVNIDSLMKSLNDAAKAQDLTESEALVSDIGNEVDDISELMSTLSANVDDDASRKARLEEGVVSLKRYHAALGQIVPPVVGNPNNNDLWKQLQDLMDRIRGTTNDLINAAMQTTPQELLGLGADLEEALRNLREAADKAKQNPDGVMAAAANVSSKLKPQLELASKYAATADPQTAAALNKAIDTMKNESALLAAAAKDVNQSAKKGDDKALAGALARLIDAMDKLGLANKGLVNSAIADPEAEARALTEAMASTANSLKKSLANGDVKGAAAALSEFQEAARRKIYLASILAADTDDLDLRRQLLELSKQLEEDIGRGLMDAMKLSLKNPKDEKARLEAERKLANAQSAALALDKLGTAASPEDKYAQNGKVLIRTAELVKLGVTDGNFVEAGPHLKTLRDQLGRHRQLANTISENCAADPAIGKSLHRQCDTMDDLYKQIVVATKDSMTDPSKKEEVAQLVAEFQKVSAQSTEESKRAKASRAEAERKAKEEADRLARQHLQEEDLAGKNDIYKAAHKVSQAVKLNMDENDGSPQDMLIRAAEKIAEAMKLLSSLSESDNTKDTIEQAKNIANFVSEIVRWANKVAAECSDPKLAQELRDTAGVAKNFSIQLKIVCAVKASSGDDPTANRSLITCAQGLCKHVVECVDVSRIAKLKKKLH